MCPQNLASFLTWATDVIMSPTWSDTEVRFKATSMTLPRQIFLISRGGQSGRRSCRWKSPTSTPADKPGHLADTSGRRQSQTECYLMCSLYGGRCFCAAGKKRNPRAVPMVGHRLRRSPTIGLTPGVRFFMSCRTVDPPRRDVQSTSRRSWQIAAGLDSRCQRSKNLRHPIVQLCPSRPRTLNRRTR